MEAVLLLVAISDPIAVAARVDSWETNFFIRNSQDFRRHIRYAGFFFPFADRLTTRDAELEMQVNALCVTAVANFANRGAGFFDAIANLRIDLIKVAILGALGHLRERLFPGVLDEEAVIDWRDFDYATIASNRSHRGTAWNFDVETHVKIVEALAGFALDRVAALAVAAADKLHQFVVFEPASEKDWEDQGMFRIAVFAW